MKEFLIGIVKARVSEKGWMWFGQALQSTAAPAQVNKLLGYYCATSRKLGKQALFLNELEKESLHSLKSDLSLDHWGVDEAARAVAGHGDRRLPNLAERSASCPAASCTPLSRTETARYCLR